jgi:hypothetical protein
LPGQQLFNDQLFFAGFFILKLSSTFYCAGIPVRLAHHFAPLLVLRQAFSASVSLLQIFQLLKFKIL